jgi:hypothetical protein
VTDIVGVHGIAQQQRGRHQLLDEWAPALADGIERSVRRRVAVPELDIAYYGDLFLEPPTDGKHKGATPDPNPDPEAALLDELGAEEAEVLDHIASGLVSDVDVAGAEEAEPDKGIGRVPRPLQTMIAALDRRFGRRGAGVLLMGELRQVRRYLLDPELKRAVDARTRDAAAGCRVLIGHSLGSVVAFEYVRQNPDHHLDLLLTAGSPLGLRVIQQLMPGASYGAAAGIPANTAAWVNVRDPRDPVAAAGPLDTHWAGIKDVPVDNEKSAHAVRRYLGKAQVGDAIRAVLPALAP